MPGPSSSSGRGVDAAVPLAINVCKEWWARCMIGAKSSPPEPFGGRMRPDRALVRPRHRLTLAAMIVSAVPGAAAPHALSAQQQQGMGAVDSARIQALAARVTAAVAPVRPGDIVIVSG